MHARRGGGALPVVTAGHEKVLPMRAAEHATQKSRIATAAARLLEGAESVFIDEGSTAAAFAEKLHRLERPFTIVTHSLPVAMSLSARPETEVLLLGGRLRPAALATVGAAATLVMRDLTIDLAVLGASGITLTRGAGTTDPATAELKRTAMTSARRSIFVAAHAKFGARAFCRYADAADFDTLVTDSGLPGSAAARYRAAGARVIGA